MFNREDVIMPLRALAIVLVGILVSSTSPAGGVLGEDAAPKHGIGDVFPVMAKALAVELVAFDAVVEDAAVVLSWETASEIDNEGFNVLRGTDPYGDLVAVNDRLIPAEGGPAFGSVYGFVDTTVEEGIVYYYVLEDVATSGVHTLLGAFSCQFDNDCEPLEIATFDTSAIFIDGFELGNTSAWSSE